MVSNIDKNFWKGKRVLLTGHTGFKGSWLALWLKQLGAELTGFSLPPQTTPNLFELANVSCEMVSLTGNIHDLENIKSIIKKYKPEIIFHMAAQSLVQYSYKNPVETYMTNVIGTVNLFESVRQAGGAKVVVNITSDKCYENKEKREGYKEDEPMGGYDPYSSSKGCAELITAAYRRSFFSPGRFNDHKTAISSVRAGNVIGGGDWSQDRLIPDIVRGIIDKRTIKIRHPHATRPWQYVLEPLSGYLILAQKMWNDGIAFSDSWNFGPDEKDEREVEWIVQNFEKKWQEKINWTIEEDSKFHEAHYLRLDSAKARTKIGWSPVWKINTALEKTVEWYKIFVNAGNIKDITISQIENYENVLALKAGTNFQRMV